MSDDEIETAIAGIDHENSALDREECPACREPLKGTVDKRQDGFQSFTKEEPFLYLPEGLPSSLVWVNYRCKVCRYAVDRVEARAS